MGVDIGAVAAEEPAERDACRRGERDREAAGSTDGTDDWNAGGERLLDEFERSPAAQQKDGIVEWPAAGKQGCACDFVDGIVASDIFLKSHEFPCAAEEGGGVLTARAVEGSLGGALKFRKLEKHGGVAPWSRGWSKGRVHGKGRLHACFAADPAARGREDMTGEPVEIDSSRIGDEDIHDPAAGRG